MDPLGDPLTTHQIQTGWEFTMELYPSGQFGYMDDLDCQFGNGLDWTWTRTRSDGPEPLLTLFYNPPSLKLVMMSLESFLPINADHTLIIHHNNEVFLVLLDSHDPKPLTHCWHKYLGWGTQSIPVHVTYKNRRYNCIGRMWICSPVNGKYVRLKLIDPPMMLTIVAY